MTEIPLEHKGRYTLLRGNTVKTWISSSSSHAFAAIRVLTCMPRDPATCPPASNLLGATGSRLRPLTSVWVLWLNQVTQWVCGEPPQTPRANSAREPLPCTGSYPRLHLAFLANMRLALDPIRPPGPSSRANLSLHGSEASQGLVLSRSLFTCTNSNQAATCTCNTRLRVSPYHVVNHSSHQEAIIH
jgi:hypothetical protein